MNLQLPLTTNVDIVFYTRTYTTLDSQDTVVDMVTVILPSDYNHN